jgi:hypothetical protein
MPSLFKGVPQLNDIGLPPARSRFYCRRIVIQRAIKQALIASNGKSEAPKIEASV